MFKPKKNEIRKPSKTLAGVTPIAVMCYPRKCNHGTCLYCPSLDVPQSYTPLSPPVIRAKMLKYDSYEQVKSRLKAFSVMNHPTDKIEMIVLGGTFLQYHIPYQYEFIKRIYDALNGKISRDLNSAKKLNEKAKHRCVALCIETRPDNCSDKEIKRMLEFGCTRVELGVQAIDDYIYSKINRGHKIKDVIDATKRLKEAGFKVGYHIMPGLPYSNPSHDLVMFKKIFSSQDYKPDQLKIYPCQVLKGSGLIKLYEKGKFHPYTKEQISSLLVKMLKIVPEYCRVMRIMREIPPVYLVKGTERIDLRAEVEKLLRKDKIKLKEIRYREIGFAIRDSIRKIDNKLKLKKTEYNASGGKEIFLQFVNKDNILFGLLRLRIRKDSSIVREIHVYGQAEAIGSKSRFGIQHKGLGKRLMEEAENLTRKYKKNKIYVISGVGVRGYYKKLGYRLENEYMVKDLK